MSNNSVKFVELSFDPGSRNFGQSIVSIYNNKDPENSENYMFEHVKHVDLIGKDGTKSNTEHILTNLNNHLKTNISISNFVELRGNPKYSLEVGIECQEGVGRGKGSGALAKSLIKMGVISGHVAGYFLEKGIRVKFLPKKSKWNYSEKEHKENEKENNSNQQKSKIINKKNSPSKMNIVNNKNYTIKGKITKNKNYKSKLLKEKLTVETPDKPTTKKKNHKINTINTIVKILENNNTKNNNTILRWRKKNKSKFVHIADSISGGMERLKHRIIEKN